MSVPSPSVWTKEGVADFLLSIGVDESDTDSAAAALLTAGYKTITYLLSARSDHLEKAKVPFPVIGVILAHQKKVENLSRPPVGCPALSDELMKQVWYSVLRIDNEETGERATALVFDIHKDESGPFLLLLVNKHFKFMQEDLMRLSYSEDEQLFIALKFTGNEVSVFQDGGELDFIIYKIYLDDKEWDTDEPGKARRREEVTAKPIKRPKRAAAPTSEKRASIICKTPRYTYEMRLSMPVRVIGFPGAVNGRWQVDTTIASIERDAFYLPALSCPGLSGGAVVASCMGQIVGIVRGALDAKEEGKVQRFATYAIPAHSLPVRPSSQPPSPED